MASQASPLQALSAQLQASPPWAMQEEHSAKKVSPASSTDETARGTHPHDTSAHAAANQRERSAPAHSAAPCRTASSAHPATTRSSMRSLHWPESSPDASPHPPPTQHSHCETTACPAPNTQSTVHPATTSPRIPA